MIHTHTHSNLGIEIRMKKYRWHIRLAMCGNLETEHHGGGSFCAVHVHLNTGIWTARLYSTTEVEQYDDVSVPEHADPPIRCITNGGSILSDPSAWRSTWLSRRLTPSWRTERGCCLRKGSRRYCFCRLIRRQFRSVVSW